MAFVNQLIGFGFFGLAFYLKVDLDINTNFYVMLVLGSILCFAWAFSAFIAEMLAESLTIQADNQSFYKSTEMKVSKQRQVSKILTDFLLYYCAIFQILTIVILFSSISKFLITSHISMEDIYNFLGAILMQISLFWNMHAMISSFEMVYSHFEELTLEVQSHLDQNTEKKERRKWKSLLRQLSTVKPFSARGYFDITKETITSMVSVRYDFQCKTQILNSIFV